MNTLDIIILIFLACVIIYAVSFNITNTLNDKLSKIAINIPPISIPQPQITVKVQKGNALNDSYDVFIEKNKSEQESQIVSLSPIEGFSETGNASSEELEKTETESKALMNKALQDFQQNQQHTSQQIQPKQQVSKPSQPICNKSIVTNKINAYGQMYWNSRELNNQTFPMCSNCCDNILSDDRTEDCVVNDYKKYQQFVKTYLEDPVIRGANVNDYDNLSDISNVGKIDLLNGETQPKPIGFVFNTSPAYNR